MPLCYHPSLEYQLDGLPRSATQHVDALFPGAVANTRRAGIVNSLQTAGVSVEVRHRLSIFLSIFFGLIP